MEPGRSYDIEIEIPKDHTRGTYWYHPHHHGSADVQMTSGMAGVVVIKGDFDDVPAIVAATERVLLLNEVLFTSLPEARDRITIWKEDYNGQRPHSSLGNLTPNEFATKQASERQAA